MPDVRLWTNDVMASRDVARDGGVLTVVPEWLVEEEVERGRLVVLLAGWSLPPGVASVAYRRHAGRRSAVRAVVDHLVATTAFAGRR